MGNVIFNVTQPGRYPLKPTLKAIVCRVDLLNGGFPATVASTRSTTPRRVPSQLHGGPRHLISAVSFQVAPGQRA